MEGLKVREIPCSECFTNKDERLDTDFYLFVPKHNPNLRYKKIRDCLLYSQYGLSIAMNEDCIGYPIYRMNEIHNMLCDNEVLKYADISEDTFIPFALNDKDVLFNRTNSYEFVGRTSIYYLKNEPRTFASYLVRFVPNPDIIKPEYLTVFLNSKYGYSDIKRRARQSVNQTNVNPEEVKEIEIPLLPMDIQQEVASMLVLADKSLNHSDDLYSQAQKLLQSALSLSSYTPIIPATAEKSLRESFIKTGRIDAEYYQPKYEHIENEIKDSVLGCWHLTDGMIADANYNPESDFLYHYIELSDIGHSGEITGYTEATGDELPTRARRVVQTDDVLLSYLEGSLTSCALIDKNHAGCLCSNGFYVLRDLPIRPEVMLVLLKSDTIQQLLHKGCSGHIMASISKDELKKIAFPTLDDQTQAQIAALIRESFALRDEANQLLSDARQLVETTIENM